MSKLIGFYKDIDYYLDMFEAKADKGDYPSAFNALKMAEKLSDKYLDDEFADINLAYAQGYAEVGRFGRSNEHFYALLKRGLAKPDCYFGLAQNLNILGRASVANSYIKLLVESEHDIPVEEIIDAFSKMGVVQGNEKAGYGVVYSKGGDRLENAGAMLAMSNLDGAAEELEQIDKRSEYYKRARNDLAGIYIIRKKYDKAMAKTKEALEENANDVIALCNLYLLNYVAKNEDALFDIEQRLRAVKDMSLYELTKTATTFCEAKKHLIGAEYLERYLKEKPYNFPYMVLLGQAYYNGGEIEKSAKVFSDMVKLDYTDPIAKYYARYVIAAKTVDPKERKPLMYSPQLPYSETVKMYKETKILIKNGNFEMLSQEDSRERELFDWFMEYGMPQDQISLVYALEKSNYLEKEEELEKLLLRDDIQKSVKIAIVKSLFSCGEEEAVLVDNFRLKTVKCKTPTVFFEFPKVLMDAYYLACAMLSFIDEKKILRLVKLSTDVYTAYLNNNLDFRSYRTLAALLLSKVDDQPFAEDMYCKMLNVKPALLAKYKNLLTNGKTSG